MSPHPDDELLGAPATLMALRDAGWRVINLACSLGRPDDNHRRRAELTKACERAGFELVIPDGLPPIGMRDNLARAQAALTPVIIDALDESGAELIVGPSPHDAHHGHEVVGRAIRDAVEKRRGPMHVMFWGLWSDLPIPNLLVPFDAARLAEIQRALRAHAGELARNRFDRLLEGRAAANAVLGSERVFGFGAAATAYVYTELLTDARWSVAEGWRLTAARELDASRPAAGAAPAGADIGFWLHAPSVSSLVGR